VGGIHDVLVVALAQDKSDKKKGEIIPHTPGFVVMHF
jgi:hypothetical protein